jgi:hypothetical protein
MTIISSTATRTLKAKTHMTLDLLLSLQK